MRIILTFIISLFALNPAAFCQNKAIDTTETISIGGIRQVICIKGKDSSKPVLLYLHGAGGNSFSVIDSADKLTSKLQEHFVVVLWDQREYGRTYKLNPSPKPLTVSLLVNDTQEVVDYLLKTFHRKKIYIAAHSMGCVTGTYVAQRHPEDLYALIEMSPPVNAVESQRIGLAMLKKHYKQVGNQRAVKELATIKLPARDFESLFIKYIWQTEYDGEHISDSVRAQIKSMMKQWMSTSAASLSNQLFEMNFAKKFPAFKCPVYFFVGRKDYATNATITAKYEQQLKAPKKQLYWFEKSAHGIPDTEPDLMQDIIINKILPVTR